MPHPETEAEVYEAAFAEGWATEPLLTVSEWADLHRMLSSKASAEPGHWRTDRAPYLREIMDSLSVVNQTRRVVFMKGSQLGATECGNNWMGYIIHHAPGPILMVQPTVEIARRVSKQRLAPMIESTPALSGRVSEARSRDSGNTTFVKEFPGGLLILTGSNSGAGLRSMPIRYLFCDEIDEYPGDVDGQGDPISLAEKRTATFARRKVFLVSTPTILHLSRIESEFKRSDQRRYFVPCPGCGNFDWIRWENIRWTNDDPDTAMLACEACGELIPEARKTEMLARGEWRSTAAGDGQTRGYHLSGLYSPLGWNSWASIVREFLECKDDRFKLKTWINTILGESWEEPTDKVDDSELFARRETYAAPVPAGVLVLTAGVDVQDDRLEMEIVGWGPHTEAGKGLESWSIARKVIHGDPALMETWDRLDAELTEPYEHEDGYRIRISVTCIDSGGHHTQRVYAFCRQRQSRMIYAIKGMAGIGRPIVSQPSPKRTGRNRRPVKLWIVGVDQAKGEIYSQLRQRKGGPGYCHFPRDDAHDEEFFAQLTAERVVYRKHEGRLKRVWFQVYPRNEALDCRVYAFAALEILSPNWAQRRRRAAARKKVQVPPIASLPTQPEPVARLPLKRPRVPRRGWLNSWR